MESLYEKHGKKKVYFSIVIILIILNIIIWNISYQRNISFSINEQKFKYQFKSEKNILFKDKVGNMVRVTIEEDDSYTPFNIIANKYQIQYKDKIIKCDFSNFIDKGGTIILSDGSEYTLSFSDMMIGDQYRFTNSWPFDVQLVNNISNVYDFIQENDFFMLFFITIPMIFFGLILIMYPREMWEFQYRFTVRNGEPTDWSIISNQFGGVIFICAALIIPLLMMRK